ncbi:sigma-B regulation protein RsbU (phosphoserine phosphatase) [Marmoricola sp. OAE513]|uniref:PP2C family protein-serine/threonine phosphatase n=1 Tax=Marmoricola sp. OAE513 TaxID=2817894 RepID=UPI001AE33F68
MTSPTASFDDVLEKLRDELGSDTASLLLLDESGEVLEPAASAGLGRVWRGATHVRVGAGFAGRIASERAPVLLDDVRPSTVLNPVLRHSGVRTLLGVPVESGVRLLGVLHVGSKQADHEFTAADVDQLKGSAAEIAERLSMKVGTDDHTAALALQRSLLPAAPPLIDGLDIAVRYLPADGDLGGDWYDVFTLPDGRVCLVMGDVQGHGLRAAVIMGRLRSALRAYALEHSDPATVLTLLDRKLCHFENNALATVAFAITEPPYEKLVISLAGHPPPIIARAGDGTAHPSDLSTDLLLGHLPDFERHSHTVDLEPGTVVALHTDGLTDVKPTFVGHANPYEYRMTRIRAAFTSGIDAETACANIIAGALGDDTLQDDVALLVLRRI